MPDDVKRGNKPLLSAQAIQASKSLIQSSNQGKLGDIPMHKRDNKGLRGNKGVGFSVESLLHTMRDDKGASSSRLNVRAPISTSTQR